MNKQLSSTAAYYQGIKGEKIALEYLQKHHYQILETRYKTPYGEIDIIAKAEEYIIFIEVKMRNTIHDALHSLNETQQNRIINAALNYLENHNLSPDTQNFRFDFFAIQKNGEFEHLINAF